jgi:signal transduction histidine kinase
MDLWMLAAAANVVLLVTYLIISTTVARGLRRSGQGLRDNPLGWATAAIFLTCALHHGAHPVHMLLPVVDADAHIGHAMRDALSSWPLAIWDVIGAGVGVWYLTLRNRFPALVRGAAIFEDMRERQRQALEIHDNVVQGLTAAKLSFEVGQHERALETVEQTLAASRRIITELLGDQGTETALEPGDFRRAEAASA